MGQKLKLGGWSRAQTAQAPMGGGTESAGAMPVGRARPHGEVPAQCTPEARN